MRPHSARDMPSRLIIGLLLGLGAAIIWGGHAVVARLALNGQGFHVLDLGATRYIPTGIILAPIAWRIRHRLRELGPWRMLLLVAMGGVGNQLTFVSGLQWAPASHGGTISPMIGPVVAAIAGWVLLGERPTRGRIMALGVMVAGVLLIGWEGLASDRPDVWKGDLLLLVAGATWGVFGALLRLWQLPAIPAASAVAVASAILVTPPWIALAAQDFLALPWQLQLWMTLAQGLMLGILAMGMFARSLDLLGPTRASTISVFVPVSALLLAWLILDETMGPLQLIGATIAVSGMLAAVLFTGRR